MLAEIWTTILSIICKEVVKILPPRRPPKLETEPFGKASKPGPGFELCGLVNAGRAEPQCLRYGLRYNLIATGGQVELVDVN